MYYPLVVRGSPYMTHSSLLLTTLSLSLALAACSGDDGSTSESTTTTASTTSGTTDDSTTDDTTTASTTSGTTTTASTTETTGEVAMAMIRVVHLSPDAPAVDVFVVGLDEAVVKGLAVKNATDYLSVPAGAYAFAIAPAGGSIDDAVFTTPVLDLAADTKYSAVAVGKLAPGNGDGGFNVVALVDSTDGLAAGQVRLQVLHAAAAAPFAEVDVWEVSDPMNPVPLIENFKFEASGSLDVPSAALVVGLDVNNDGMPDATFNVPALPADSLVDVAAFSDAADAPSLQAVLGVGATTQLDPNP